MENLKKEPKPRVKNRPRIDEPPLEPKIPQIKIVTFFLLILAFLIYDLVVVSRESVDFLALKTDLQNNVFNQSEALDSLLKTLDSYEKQEELFNVVNFMGSTGIGKTFVANIVKAHFSFSVCECSDFKSRSFNEIFVKMKGCTLIIFDDLRVEDVESLVLVLQKLPHDTLTLVINIFNIQETDDFLTHNINYSHFDTIEKGFENSKIAFSSAKFREFTSEEAQTWLLKLLQSRKIDVHSHSKTIQNILLNQNVKYHGLKGLSTKIQVEL